MTGDAFLAEPAGPGRAVQGAETGHGRPAAPILDQEFDSDTLPALRAAVRAHACQAGMPEDRAGDVVLAVHELAANAITHGAGTGRLRMWNRAGVLGCEILDVGPPDPGFAAGPSTGARGGAAAAGTGGSGDQAVTAPWPIRGGHGLWLVRRVADQLDLQTSPRGTRATATFALPRRPSSRLAE
jgi:anti-sigma regulatory factor (Ser/Thr protein kinase)